MDPLLTYVGNIVASVEGVVSGIGDLADVISHEKVSAMDGHVVCPTKESYFQLVADRRSTFTSVSM